MLLNVTNNVYCTLYLFCYFSRDLELSVKSDMFIASGLNEYKLVLSFLKNIRELKMKDKCLNTSNSW